VLAQERVREQKQDAPQRTELEQRPRELPLAPQTEQQPLLQNGLGQQGQ
jgi:hypothetical protein